MRSNEFITEIDVGNASPVGTYKKGRKSVSKQRAEELMTEGIIGGSAQKTLNFLWQKMSKLPGFVKQYNEFRANTPLLNSIAQELAKAKKEGTLTKEKVISIFKSMTPVSEAVENDTKDPEVPTWIFRTLNNTLWTFLAGLMIVKVGVWLGIGSDPSQTTINFWAFMAFFMSLSAQLDYLQKKVKHLEKTKLGPGDLPEPKETIPSPSGSPPRHIDQYSRLYKFRK